MHKAIDALVSAYHEIGGFDGTVLVTYAGELLYERGVGYANHEWEIPNAPDVVYDLASVSKQFTAALILGLAEQGLVDIDAPISEYLPALKKEWSEKITLAQLMNHSSGVPRTPFEYTDKDQSDSFTLDEVVQILNRAPLDFEPGESWSYSNAGYNLLAAVVERVTGTSLAEALRTRIFEPLEMRASFLGAFPNVVPRRASGYESKLLFDVLRVPDSTQSEGFHGPAAILSSPRDMAKWDRALHSDFLFGAQLKQRMFTNLRSGYGFGWYIDRARGAAGKSITLARHSGWAGSFGGIFWRYLEPEHCIIIQQNNGGVPWALARQISNVLFGREQDEFPKRHVAGTLIKTLFQSGQQAALKALAELPPNVDLRGYEPGLACGPPDASPGDSVYAWASKTKDDQSEWLELNYEEPLEARAVHVHENQNPGAIKRIVMRGAEGQEAIAEVDEVVLSRSARGVQVSLFPIYAEWPITSLRLEIDSPAVLGWNEIDAVGIEDMAGKLHWAQSASASSTAADLVQLDSRATPKESDLRLVGERLQSIGRVAEGFQLLGFNLLAFPESPQARAALERARQRYKQ